MPWAKPWLPLLLLACLYVPAFAALRGARKQSKAAESPVAKVISLLTGLQEQLEEEGKEEAAAYDKFACYCKEQMGDKFHDIEKSKKKISKLTSEANELEAEIAELNAQISELGKTIAHLKESIVPERDFRKMERDIHKHAELSMREDMDRLVRAIEGQKASKDEMQDAKLAFEQLSSTVKHFLSLSRQEPTKYEYHSNDIIGTLENLLDEFKDRLKALLDMEFRDQAAFEKRELGVNNQVKFQEKDRDEKSKVSDFKTEKLNNIKQDLDEEKKAKQADEYYQQDIVQECEKKATLWDQRSKLRAEELSSIAQAMDALKEKVAPNWKANKKLADLQLTTNGAKHGPRVVSEHAVHPEGLAETVPLPPSLLQTSGKTEEASRATAAAERAAHLLSESAKRLGSQELANMALRAEAFADHFGKVRSIVQDLLKRLAEEARQEGTQKSFCDQAMRREISTRDFAKGNLEVVKADLSRRISAKEEGEEHIVELSNSISKLQKGLMEATELRENERKDNEQTIAEAKEGTSGTQLALEILGNFYDGAQEDPDKLVYNLPDLGTERSREDRDGKTVKETAPDTFEENYQGETESSKFIIGMLETIHNDFVRTVKTVTLDEKNAEREFEFMKKETDFHIKHKQHNIKNIEKFLVNVKQSLLDLQSAEKEQSELLDDAEQSLDKLKPYCADDPESHEDRAAAREKEIAALQEALDILYDWQGES